MKLTNKGRYAVMAMADLASNANNRPISLAEISIYFHKLIFFLSKSHEKFLQQ